jgi:hypothetical protein
MKKSILKFFLNLVETQLNDGEPFKSDIFAFKNVIKLKFINI